MVKILDLFRLIRWKNLVIIALTQYLIRYALQKEIIKFLILDNIQFLLLVISTLLVAAAGYIINDYFDIQVDQHNKRKIIVGNTIKRREAIVLHFVFSGLGIGIGFYLGYKIGIWNLGFINLFSVIALWFYSTYFKRNYLSGNILISLLSALTLIIVGLYDLLPASKLTDIETIIKTLYYSLPNSKLSDINSIHEYTSAKRIVVFKAICIYASFAFVTSLIREIIKDLEDLEGDQKMGYQTYAIVSGKKKTKNIVQSLSILTIIGIACILYLQFQSDILSFSYVLFFVKAPFLFFIWKLKKAESSKDFHSLSILIKIIMLTGILSMIVFTFLTKA